MEWRRRVEDAVGKELFFQAHEMILNIKELSNIQIDPQLKEHLAPMLMKMLKWINLSYIFPVLFFLISSLTSSSTCNWKEHCNSNTEIAKLQGVSPPTGLSCIFGGGSWGRFKTWNINFIQKAEALQVT